MLLHFFRRKTRDFHHACDSHYTQDDEKSTVIPIPGKQANIVGYNGQKINDIRNLLHKFPTIRCGVKFQDVFQSEVNYTDRFRKVEAGSVCITPCFPILRDTLQNEAYHRR